MAGRQCRPAIWDHDLNALAHDPEKWKPVFPRDKRDAFARRSCSNKKVQPESDSTRLNQTLGAWCVVPQVEYLNSGIAFSSSLVALNTAWSGYHGLDFDAEAGAVLVPVEPVVVDDAGRLPVAFEPPDTPM